MAALTQFEAAEANLVKLERLWEEIVELIPTGIKFGSDPNYEDRCRSFRDVLAALPMIDGWKPEYGLLSLNDIAQSRFEANDLMELEIYVAVEESIEAPGKDLREYRFRFNKKRLALIQDALSELIDFVDSDIRKIKINIDPNLGMNARVVSPYWNELRDHINQIDTLLGSSIKRPQGWNDFWRHLHFGLICDFNDIEQVDWPSVKVGLRKSLYGVNDPIPVQVKDISDLVASRPRGPIATRLNWEGLNPDEFERLIFALISAEHGYENPEWLMQSNAPDRGRDLSVTRVVVDGLYGTIRSRVIIQCKHWLSRSVSVSDVTTLIAQMKLWEPPRIDVHVIATSGRFTSDAVEYIEKYNQSDNAMRIEMWPESHLERLLAARPSIIAEFRLR
ncbi:MAG TPA: restriction endonuclease [Methanothrix sp.]|nr:restriction endonuclease [Methanothrix sp.]